MNKWNKHKYDSSLVGKKFGELELLKIIPLYRKKYRYYKCEVKCFRCGNQSEMLLNSVINGKTGVCKSCACKSKPSGAKCGLTKDITGQRFGHLVAIQVDAEIKKRGVYWKFKCDCGREKSILGKRVRDGSHTSCGCSEMRTGMLSKSWKGYEEIPGKYWHQIVNGAKERNILFSLKIEDIWQIFLRQDRKCALTNEPIQFNNPKTASLDRIDSTKGYTLDNVQWVHVNINIMKMDMNETEFIRFCQLVTNHKKVS